jgi:hypothetical protein
VWPIHSLMCSQVSSELLLCATLEWFRAPAQVGLGVPASRRAGVKASCYHVSTPCDRPHTLPTGLSHLFSGLHTFCTGSTWSGTCLPVATTREERLGKQVAW